MKETLTLLMRNVHGEILTMPSEGLNVWDAYVIAKDRILRNGEGHYELIGIFRSEHLHANVKVLLQMAKNAKNSAHKQVSIVDES